MIYTVTLNPSLDYIVTVQDFRTGTVNRTKDELIYPGGKGINVSIVLKNLGLESTALGFIAGFTGEELSRRLKEKGVTANFISVKEGLTRINVKIRSGEESEINGQGPVTSEKELETLLTILDQLQENDILVLAGSIPESIPSTIYRTIMERLSQKKIKTVVDATKDLLLNVLQYRPFLIKPNNHELSEIFGKELKSTQEIIQHAKKLKEMGAQNVLISMAGDGAVLITEQGDTYFSEAPKGILKNSVGAGDSMVAGFIAGYLNTGDYKEAFKMGISTGSASAFSEELATKEEVLGIYSTHKFNITR
ncbi:MAG TPA: 1-phosphofructokinase [Mobilitalea sp.]|nr:1-phosphofructokinase [Mobilitalea sp.]